MIPRLNSAKARSPAIGFNTSAASAAVVMSVFPCACKVAAVLIMMAIATILETAMPVNVSIRMRRNSCGACRGRFLRGRASACC